MKYLLLFLLLSVISSEGRLLPINRTKTLEEVQTDKPNPSIRLTRDIEDILMGFSNEETAVSDEFVRSHMKRAKNFNKYYMDAKPPLPKTTRHARELGAETTKKPLQLSSQKPAQSQDKDKKVLVKKPIPKFNELDYDDDFQAKMNRFLTSMVESGEHEDEDFNVDDYDFDVNHDEYAGRGKPLEPRLNYKQGYEKAKTETKSGKKILSKPVLPVKLPNKKGRSANKEELPSKNRDMDYYEDLTTKATKTRASSESEYDDEDSIESDKKKSSKRTIRSWDIAKYADKFTGKPSVNLVKLLSILPLFPQLPSELEEFEDAEYAATGKIIDPTKIL